ncbi:unnamed protein product [Camellia sinensis]
MDLECHLSSQKSSDDPAPGEFTYRCDPQGYPPNILSSGSTEVFQAGPWNGIKFSGKPSRLSNSTYTFELVYTKEEVYYDYKLISSVVSRLAVNHSGVVQCWTWIDRTQKWVIVLTSPTDNCDNYKLCDPNGNCNVGNSSACGCLSKFVPKNQTEWGNGDWSNGCVRRTLLDCHNRDGFVKYSGYKMPDTRNSWFDRNMTLGECEMSSRIEDSTVRQVGSNGKKREIVAVTLALLIGLLLLGISLIVYLQKRKRNNSQLNREGILMHESEQGYTNKTQKEDLELPLFDLTVIVDSTNNFSINKIGEGGFRPVYKDQSQSTLLDWSKRFYIINGIARGLLYLHQNSRLRIIHRDLKASNILLDIDMNPKISDFGIARSFGGNEIEANTNRVIGTYGYMSPEYAIEGYFQ